MRRTSPVPPELATLDSVARAVAVQLPEPVCITVNVSGVADSINVNGVIVNVVARCEKAKGLADKVSVRDPGMEEKGPRPPIASHGAPEVGVQVQTLGSTTFTFRAAPVESNLNDSGETRGC